MAALAGGGMESLGEPPPSRGYRPLSRSEGGTLTSLAVSLLDRMAHLKAQAEASPTTTFVVIKENRRKRKQLRAVAVTPSSVLNMRPRGSVAGIPNMKAFAAADPSVLARSGVDVAKYQVSRSMNFSDILEAAVDGDAVVLRLRNCAYEMRYHTPLAAAVVRAVQTAQARAMELDKLELLFSELGLLGGPAPSPSAAAGSPAAAAAGSSGGSKAANSGGASFSPASPDREGSRDRSRSRSKSTAAGAAKAARLERDRDAPASHSFALRALPMRLWSAAEVLTTARGSVTAAALRATLQETADAAAAEARTAGAAAGGEGGSSEVSASAGGAAAVPSSSGGRALTAQRREPTEAEAEAERVASLAQSLLYDPATPEGRTRGKFVSRDFMTAVDETVTALQRAHGLVHGGAAGGPAGVTGGGPPPIGISAAAARLDPLARSVSMLKAMGPSAAGSSSHRGSSSGRSGSGAASGSAYAGVTKQGAGKPPVRLARAFEEASAAVAATNTHHHDDGHLHDHHDGGEAAAAENDNFSDDEDDDATTAATAISREGSVRALSISSAVPLSTACAGALASGAGRSNRSDSVASSGTPGHMGSGSSCGHRPETAQLPLFAALREVNALLVHYMLTRRRDMLGSVRTKLPWGATLNGDADPDGEVEAAEQAAAARAAASVVSAPEAVAAAADAASPEAAAAESAKASAVAVCETKSTDDAAAHSRAASALSVASSAASAVAAAAFVSHSRSTSAASEAGTQVHEESSAAAAGGLEMPPLAAAVPAAGVVDAAEAERHGSVSSASSASSRDVSLPLPAGVLRVGRASVIAAHAQRASERAIAAAAAAAATAEAETRAASGSASAVGVPAASSGADAAESAGAFAEAELLRCPWYVRTTIEDVATLLVESLAQPLTVRSVVQREVEASFWNVVTLRRAVADALRAVVDADAADSIAAKLRRLRSSARRQSFFGVPPHLEAADGWASAALELRDADRHACPREKMDALLGAVRSIYKSHARAHAAAILSAKSSSGGSGGGSGAACSSGAGSSAGETAGSGAGAAASSGAEAAPAAGSAGAVLACTAAHGHHGPCPRHGAATALPQHFARVTVLAERLPALGADEFLPIFLYTLVSSSLADPASLNELLWATMDEADLRSHGGYYLTVLEAALEYIAALPEG